MRWAGTLDDDEACDSQEKRGRGWLQKEAGRKRIRCRQRPESSVNDSRAEGDGGGGEG